MAGSVSRFDHPSSSLDLRFLARKAREAAGFSLVAALAVHLLLTGIGGLESEQTVPKPLTTQFVKRAPRLTKPLELKKRPRPRRREVRREMVSVRARELAGRPLGALHAAGVASSLARPRASVSRSISLGLLADEGTFAAQVIQGDREPHDRVDLGLDMVDIDALDTGRYQAMVIQNPDDKRDIKGFLHIAAVGAQTILANPRSLLAQTGDFWKFVKRVPRVMNRYTDIKTDVVGHYTFDDRRLLKTPWIFVTSDIDFELTYSEAHNLGAFFVSGGFAYVESAWPGFDNPGDVGLRRMLKEALATQGLVFGRDWTFQRLPNSHPVYHCYFDFHNGPPPGHDVYHSRRSDPNCGWGMPVDHMQGIEIRGRTYAVVSNKDLEGFWCHLYGNRNMRQVQFLVNLIVFALTQEGSMTHRLMQTVH